MAQGPQFRVPQGIRARTFEGLSTIGTDLTSAFQKGKQSIEDTMERERLRQAQSNAINRQRAVSAGLQGADIERFIALNDQQRATLFNQAPQARQLPDSVQSSTPQKPSIAEAMQGLTNLGPQAQLQPGTQNAFGLAQGADSARRFSQAPEEDAGVAALRSRLGEIQSRRKDTQDLERRGLEATVAGKERSGSDKDRAFALKEREFEGKEADRLISKTRSGVLNEKTKAETAKLLFDAQKAGRDGSGGRELSSTAVTKLDEGQAVSRLLPDVKNAIRNNKNLFGPVEGNIRKNVPFDVKAQKVQAQLRVASQAFGRYMEGGVLRKEDEIKYEKMFPQLGDKLEVAEGKLQIVDRILAQKFNSNMTALGRSGFDVSGFDPLEEPPSLFDDTGLEAEIKRTVKTPKQIAARDKEKAEIKARLAGRR